MLGLLTSAHVRSSPMEPSKVSPRDRLIAAARAQADALRAMPNEDRVAFAQKERERLVLAALSVTSDGPDLSKARFSSGEQPLTG